jgi:hypothetical protein
MFRKHNIFLDAAGDGTGGGGAGAGGTGSGANSSGGGGPSLTGGAAASGMGAGTGQPPADGAGAGGAPTVTIPENWKSALPPELQSDSTLATIKDIGTLAKNYVHAQRMIGADKIPVPNPKMATDEDYRKIYHKLGLPEKFEDYKGAVEVAKDAGLDESFVGQFLEQAHKSGVMPKMAQGLVKWFTEANQQASQEMVEAQKNQLGQELAKVKQEWGAKYDQNVKGAEILFGKFADPEDIKFFNDSGLAQHPRIIRLLGKMSESFLTEGEIPNGNGSGGSKYTPTQAMEEMNKIYADTNHPYWNKDHPNHNTAVSEMARLSEMAIKR